MVTVPSTCNILIPSYTAEGDRLCSLCGNINCNMLKPLQLHMLHHLQLSLLAVAYAKSTRIVLAFDSEICDQSQAEFLRFCPIECNLARHVTFKLSIQSFPCGWPESFPFSGKIWFNNVQHVSSSCALLCNVFNKLQCQATPTSPIQSCPAARLPAFVH